MREMERRVEELLEGKADLERRVEELGKELGGMRGKKTGNRKKKEKAPITMTATTSTEQTKATSSAPAKTTSSDIGGASSVSLFIATIAKMHTTY